MTSDESPGQTEQFVDLVTSAVAAVVGMFVLSGIDGSITVLDLERAKRNHARFEGTWTPGELRRAKSRQIFQQFDEAEQNHAAFEGASPPVKSRV